MLTFNIMLNKEKDNNQNKKEQDLVKVKCYKCSHIFLLDKKESIEKTPCPFCSSVGTSSLELDGNSTNTNNRIGE